MASYKLIVCCFTSDWLQIYYKIEAANGGPTSGIISTYKKSTTWKRQFAPDPDGRGSSADRIDSDWLPDDRLRVSGEGPPLVPRCMGGSEEWDHGDGRWRKVKLDCNFSPEMGHFHSQILAQCRKKISSAVRNGCNLFAVKMPALARYFVPTGSVDFPITRKNHLLRCLCIKPQLLSNEMLY